MNPEMVFMLNVSVFMKCSAVGWNKGENLGTQFGASKRTWQNY